MGICFHKGRILGKATGIYFRENTGLTGTLRVIFLIKKNE